MVNVRINESTNLRTPPILPKSVCIAIRLFVYSSIRLFVYSSIVYSSIRHIHIVEMAINSSSKAWRFAFWF